MTVAVPKLRSIGGKGDSVPIREHCHLTPAGEFVGAVKLQPHLSGMVSLPIATKRN